MVSDFQAFQLFSKLAKVARYLSSAILHTNVLENLFPTSALRARTYRYWRVRTKFPGEIFKQKLLFGTGQLVHRGFDFGERAHARKFVGKFTRFGLFSAISAFILAEALFS